MDPGLVSEYSLYLICKNLRFQVLPWEAEDRIPAYWLARMSMFEKVAAAISDYEDQKRRAAAGG